MPDNYLYCSYINQVANSGPVVIRSINDRYGIRQNANVSIFKGLLLSILLPFYTLLPVSAAPAESMSYPIPVNIGTGTSEAVFVMVSGGMQATPSVAQDSRNNPIHIVEQGQTLFGIAQLYGVSVDDIIAWNGLSATDLRIGAEIQVSPPSTTSSNAERQSELASDNAPSAAVEMQSLTRKETSRLEQQYDRLINESMAIYFDPSTFIVNSRLRIEMVEQRFSERSLDQAQIRSTGQTLPGLTALPEFLQQAQRQPGTARERTVSQLVPDIQQVFVEIVVDETYTEAQREFMAYLARSVSKLDETRGDTLNITTMAFPERTRGEPDVPAAQPAQTVAGEPVEQPVAHVGQEGEPLRESLADNIYLWAGLAALVLLVMGLIFYAFGLKRRLKNESVNAASRASAGSISRVSSAAPEASDAPSGNGKAGGQITKETTRERIKESVFSGFAQDGMEPHELLYNYFMNFPGDMGRLLDMWISKDGAEGLDKAAKLVGVADKRLVTKLQPTLQESHAGLLTDYVLDIANAYKDKPGEDFAIAKTVKEVTDRLQLRERKNCLDFRLRTLKHYDFLEYTPIRILANILKNKNSYAIALAVSHLTEERANELIYKLPESVLVHVWAQMQFVNLIKYEEYVHYADELFMSLMNYEKYRIENELIDYEMVDRICGQIESRDTITQNKIYNQISQIDTEMAKEIQARIITLANLQDLPIEIVQDAAERMEAETLALSIAGVEPSVIERILEERSEREVYLLRSIIRKSKTYPAKQIEESRQHFLKTLRVLYTEDSKDVYFKFNDL